MIDKIIEGLKIITNVHSEKNFDAGHEQIWAGPTLEDYQMEFDEKLECMIDKSMSDEERIKMEELGWFIDEDKWSMFV